jgi:hypothetical protein
MQTSMFETERLRKEISIAQERDEATPTTRESLERLKQDEPVRGITSEDIVSLIQQGRAERDERIRRALASRD